MAVTVDSLNLEIQASSEEAKQGLEALEATLTKLKAATKGGFGLSSIANQLGKLGKAANGISSLNVANIKDLVTSLKSLDALKDVKISSTIATSITGIAKASNELSADGVVLIRSLVPAITSLSALKDVQISPSIGKGISEISNAARGLAGVDFSAIHDIASVASSLTALNNVKISSTIGKQLLEIAAGADAMRGVDFTPVTELSASIQPLANMRGLSLNALIKGLKQIPDVAREINTVDFAQFKANIESIASSLTPLANAMNDVGNAFKKFPSMVKQAAGSINGTSRAISGATFNFAVFSGALRNSMDAAKKIANTLKGFISDYNDYIENTNLFTVAMGKYADQARQYAEHVGTVMGIDPSEWMRNQGVFMTLAEGFGVVSDRAYVMSKNLTQLGYDISSFFNIPIEESMEKLTSGISGEIEPLRRLGFDLSQARLQAIAASLGISQTVSSMTQAQKAQLRYYAIMTQVTTAQGDMARTLSSPANQLRILAASATQAGRAIGSIFIPILNTVLPVAIAVAKAIRAIAAAIASLFGYNLPEVDFSVTVDGIGDVSSGMDDIANGAGNAGSAAKKLKSVLMGFDEINQLQDPTSGGGGGGGGAGGGGGSMSGLDFELPEYDFLSGLVGSSVDAIYAKMKPVINWVTDNLESILSIAKAIVGVFLMWKIAKAFIPDLDFATELMSKLGGLAAALAILTITVKLVYEFDEEFLKTGDPWQIVADGLTSLFSAGLLGKVVEKTFGLHSGFGMSVALAVSALTTVEALYDHVSMEGWKWDSKEIVAAIWNAIKGAGAGAAAGFALTGPAGAIAGAAIGAILTLGVTAAAVLSGISKNDIIGEIDWGNVELTAQGQKEYAQSLFNFPVTAQISLASDAVDGVNEAKATLEESIAGINTSLNTVTIKAELDTGDYATWQSNADALVSSLNGYLAKAENLVQVSVAFAPTTGEDGTDLSGSIVTALGIGNSITNDAVTRAGQQLSDLLMKGVESGLEPHETAMAIALSQSLQRIASAAAEGEFKGTAAAQTALLLSDLDENSFKGVIEQVGVLSAELESNLQAAKVAEYASIQSMLATYQQGIAEGIYTPEEQANIEEQIKALQADLAGMADIGTLVANGMDSIMGPVREQVITETQKIYNALLTGVSLEGIEGQLPSTFNDYFSALFNSEDVSITEVSETFNAAVRKAVMEATGMGKEEIEALELIGVTGFDLLSQDVQQQLYDALVNAGGVEKANAVFKELGFTIGSVTTEISEVATTATTAATDITTATTNMETGMDDFNTAVNDAQSESKKELAKVESEFGSVGDAILATGADAETLNTKIVEIPSEKKIAIEISNYTTALTKLNTIKKRVNAIGNNLTVNLKVKAGLTSGAKDFLDQLREIDSTSIAAAKIGKLIKLSQYATGGFPKSGELFIANENGRQEMVGRIGNRSAVANQDQIGEAIFRYMDAHEAENGGGINEDRLAGAIAGALKAAGIGMVSLDGKMLAQSINRESQRAGKPAINF